MLIGGLRKYQSISGLQVATAMYKKSLDDTPGVFIHTTEKIKTI